MATVKTRYISILASEITEFMRHYDPYEFRDAYSDDVETAVSEMESTLWDDSRRKGLASDLKGMLGYEEDEETASELAYLYRKVKAI